MSILAHVVIFAVIGLNAPKLVYREPPSLQAADLWLMPRLTLQHDEAHSKSALLRATTPLPTAAPPARSKPPALKSADADRPNTVARPTAPGAASSAQAAAQPDGAASYPAGVLGTLRTSIGCDIGHLAHLTPEEKDRCNQHLGETAQLGPKEIDTLPPEKRAYYDAVQAFTEASRHPEAPYYKDANGNIRSWGGPPAVGCTLKPHFKPGANMSDKIKATGMIGVPIGFLSCGVKLPQGSMTPEIGIPTP